MKKTILPSIAQPLLSWYDANARSLPWRSDPSPYRVWISEIMLQQTRVEAVKPYFERFITALPDIKSLAIVSPDVLLKLWEGLGYYNRARNLQKAAQQIMSGHDGRMPASYEELLKLPGIGPYTAGAISSIACGVQIAAVDGNVLRVISRLLASRDDITKQQVKQSITEQLNQVLPENRAGDFNQALMELGAMVCLPKGAAKCAACPLCAHCQAYARKLTAELPVKTAKKSRRIETKTIFVLFVQGKIAVGKRPESGLLAGLWELPNTDGQLDMLQARRHLTFQGYTFHSIEPLAKAKHIFTHIEWQLTGYLVRLSHQPAISPLRWITPEELKAEIALPSAFEAYRRVIDMLQDDCFHLLS